MKFRLMPMLAVFVMLSSCIGRKPVATKYYMLEYPAATVSTFALPGEEKILWEVVYIAPVDIYPAFASNQIAFREHTNQIRYFSYNEWAVRPAQSLHLLMKRFIEDSRWFARMTNEPNEALDGYSLQTSIYRLEVANERSDFQALLSLEFSLTDHRSGQVYSSGLINVRQPLRQRNLNLFAATISELFLEQMHAFFGQASIDIRNE